MYYQKQNPFRKSTIFQHLYPQKRNIQTEPNDKMSNNNISITVRQSQINNPFQKSNYDHIFNRKNYQSENKTLTEDHGYRGTFLPISRYEARMKLKQLDTQHWKRQKEQEERYKLEHFGPDALRYHSYSTTHATFIPKMNQGNNNKLGSKKNINSVEKIQDRKRQVLDQTPQSEYMIYGNQEKQKQRLNHRFTESATSIKNNNGNTHKKYSVNYQDRIHSNPNGFRNQLHEKANSYNKNEFIPKIINETQFSNSYKSNRDNQNIQQSGFFNNKIQTEENINYVSSPVFNNSGQSFAMDKKAYSKPLGYESNQFQDMTEQYGAVNNSDNLKKMSYGSNFQYDKIEKRDRKSSYGSDYINEDQNRLGKGPLDPMKFSSSEDSDSPFSRSPFSNTRQIKPSKFANSSPKWPQYIEYENREFYRINI